MCFYRVNWVSKYELLHLLQLQITNGINDVEEQLECKLDAVQHFQINSYQVHYNDRI